MPKELPYFKFEPSEWLEGEIQICSDEAKSCFINLMSGYWIKEGIMSYAFALQKYCKSNPKIIQELIEAKAIKNEAPQIRINFLDRQLNSVKELSHKRSKSAASRWKNKSTAKAMQLQSKSNAIREDKIRIKNTKKEATDFEFEKFWDAYDKKTSKIKAQKKWATLSEANRQLALKAIPAYVASTPDKKYRKDPTTFLNNESWNDEIITAGNQPVKTGRPPITSENWQGNPYAEHQ